MVRVNTLLPACLVELAAKRGARAVVIAGSSAEYSGPKAGERLNESAPVETMKLYGASKAAGGILALALGAVHGLPIGVVRLFNVYGPGEAPQRLLPTLVRHLKAGEPVPLSVGTQVRDFVHVDDACAGLWAVLCALAEGRMAGGPYNLATGAGRSVAEFACITARSMGAPGSLLDFGAIPMHPDEIPFLVGDPTALNNACSWGATRSLDQGIAAAVAELL
jgi:nucleoside-diphosphate-sugar epimerase